MEIMRNVPDFMPNIGRLILLNFIWGISLTDFRTNEKRLSK